MQLPVRSNSASMQQPAPGRESAHAALAVTFKFTHSRSQRARDFGKVASSKKLPACSLPWATNHRGQSASELRPQLRSAPALPPSAGCLQARVAPSGGAAERRPPDPRHGSAPPERAALRVRRAQLRRRRADAPCALGGVRVALVPARVLEACEDQHERARAERDGHTQQPRGGGGVGERQVEHRDVVCCALHSQQARSGLGARCMRCDDTCAVPGVLTGVAHRQV